MIVVTVLAGCAADTLPAIRGLAERFPGHETLRIDVGASRLTLGWKWRVAQSTGLLVALSEFGAVEVIEAEATFLYLCPTHAREFRAATEEHARLCLEALDTLAALSATEGLS